MTRPPGRLLALAATLLALAGCRIDPGRGTAAGDLQVDLRFVSRGGQASYSYDRVRASATQLEGEAAGRTYHASDELGPGDSSYHIELRVDPGTDFTVWAATEGTRSTDRGTSDSGILHIGQGRSGPVTEESPTRMSVELVDVVPGLALTEEEGGYTVSWTRVGTALGYQLRQTESSGASTVFTFPDSLLAQRFELDAGQVTPSYRVRSELPGGAVSAFSEEVGGAGRTVTGMVVDSAGVPIGHALAELFLCTGTDTGLRAATDETGRFAIRGAPAERVLVQLISPACSDVQTACFTVQQTGETAIPGGVVRMQCTPAFWIAFRLDWGETPPDLDLHLWTPEIEGGTHHLYFPEGCRGDRTAAPYAELDHDITDGFGPEQVTVYSGFPGTYTIAVMDYGATGLLSASGATLTVLGPAGVLAEISPPTGTGAPVWWDVCRIDGVTQAVTVVNSLSTDPPLSTEGCGLRPQKPGRE